MEITIKEICDIFDKHDQTPLPDDDVEIMKIYVTDYHDDIQKATGQSFEHLDTILFWLDMLKYDDGRGMKTAYKTATMSLATLAIWIEKVLHENQNRICEQ
jgi:hypothetical protein